MKNSILFVTTIPNALVAFLLPFADHLKQHYWRVDAMSSDIHQSLPCQQHFDHCWDVPLSRKLRDLHRSIGTIQKIRTTILQQQYKIVHVHTPIAAFIVRYALRNMKAKPYVIYTAHGFHFYPDGSWFNNVVFKGMERLAGRWTDALITINQHDFTAAKKMKLVSDECLHHVPGIGIDRHYYDARGVTEIQINTLRQELMLKSDERFLLMVAEFTAQKRHVLAVIALSKIKDETLHLVFAGSGRELESVKKLSITLGIKHRVHFLGHRNDIPILMKASKAVLLLSKREGLPRCLLEAMALGVPVIGARIRGIEDLLQDNAGILIPSGCLPSLIEAIEQLLRDDASVFAMIENAQKKLEQYDINHVLRCHADIYQHALVAYQARVRE
jgi:glycosyltransferase involved in cell wall biosynthesis